MRLAPKLTPFYLNLGVLREEKFSLCDLCTGKYSLRHHIRLQLLLSGFADRPIPKKVKAMLKGSLKLTINAPQVYTEFYSYTTNMHSRTASISKIISTNIFPKVYLFLSALSLKTPKIK